MNELKSIVEEIEALSQMPLISKSDLAPWNTRANQLLEKLHSGNQKMNDTLPHFIEHYLADADIRMKDVEYRNMQQAQILVVIEELKSRANQPGERNR